MYINYILILKSNLIIQLLQEIIIKTLTEKNLMRKNSKKEKECLNIIKHYIEILIPPSKICVSK